MGSALDLGPDEGQLLADARTGEVESLDRVMSAVRAAVCRYARAKLRTYPNAQEMADDVSQEVCMAVFCRLATFEDRGAPFAALVFAVASNKVADAQRRQARAPVTSRADEPDVIDSRPGPEREALGCMELRDLLAQISRLPAASAEIVRLRAAGFSADEVAQRLGTTPGAVRVAHHRAMKVLRNTVR